MSTKMSMELRREKRQVFRDTADAIELVQSALATLHQALVRPQPDDNIPIAVLAINEAVNMLTECQTRMRCDAQKLIYIQERNVTEQKGQYD